MRIRPFLYKHSYILLRMICFNACMVILITAVSQNYYSKNFRIEDGLPSDIIRAVFKDSRGIMWIGTGAGLCSFNGREFKVYNSSNGLAAENIFDITEDNKGNLWIGAMAEGITKFDGQTFTNYTTKDGLVCNDVRRVSWSKKFNVLLVGTNRGCSVFDGKKFYSLSDADVNSVTDSYFVLSFLEKGDYIELHAYVFPKIYRYYPSTHRFFKDQAQQANSPSASPVVGMNGDTVWSWGRKGISVWNNGRKQSFDSLGQPFHLAVDDEKHVWIAAWAEIPSGPEMPGGLYMYDGKKVIRMSEKAGITDAGVWTVYYDSLFHVVWVGTLHQGLFRIPFPCFEWYNPSYFGLSSMKINDIYADKQDNLWIATSREIIRKNKDHQFYIYPNREIKSEQYKTFLKIHPLLCAQQIDKDGSYEKYQKLRAEGKFPYGNPYHSYSTQIKLESIHPPPGSLYDPAAYARASFMMSKAKNDTAAICFFAIGEDSQNAVYVSGGFGLNRFIPGPEINKPGCVHIEGNIWVFAFDEADSLFGSSYWDNGIWHCAIYPKLMIPEHFFYRADKENAPLNPIRMISRGNEIWCASRVGGLYLTREGKNYAFSKTDKSLPQSINDICFDGSRNIIVGANNGEVLILSLEGEKLKLLHRLNGKDGIVGKSIRWVQTDTKRNLFVGSDKGLHMINLNELLLTGKPGLHFFPHETGYFDLSGKRAVVDRSGDLWIATDSRLCRILHEQVSKNQVHKAKLILAGLEINNIPIKHFPDYFTDVWFGSPVEGLKLLHEQNNLVFYFDALNYVDANQQRFRYRLLPVIKTWSNYSFDRKAVFTTLRPGNYLLEVESVNPLDQSQVAMLSYHFTIRPPFYFTWWFILLSVICSAAFIAAGLRLKASQIRKEEKQKADIRVELNSVEMKALKAQMNPHFIFNAINSIQSYILSNNVDKALYYLSMFAKLVRKTLENATKEFIPLCEELEYLNFYIELEKMRFEGQFINELDLDENVPLETTMIPPMIAQPFIENAIKHGLLNMQGNALLKLQIKKVNESQYLFIIEDNGIGRKLADKLKQAEALSHVSKGMEITSTRLKLLNENGHSGQYTLKIIDLFNSEGSPSGTRVEITFPLE